MGKLMERQITATQETELSLLCVSVSMATTHASPSARVTRLKTQVEEATTRETGDRVRVITLTRCTSSNCLSLLRFDSQCFVNVLIQCGEKLGIRVNSTIILYSSGLSNVFQVFLR